MKKTTLKWRLGKLPTSTEVQELVLNKIITQQEAREILFNQETQEEIDKKALESEIKFLRDIVEKLSESKTRTIEVIRKVYEPYYQFSWYRPYEVWCGGNTLAAQCGTTLTQASLTCSSDSNLMYLGTTGTTMTNCSNTLSDQIGSLNFSEITTF